MSLAPSASPRRVAIFGATSGIAAAVARRFAASGARLVLVGRDGSALGLAAQDLRVRGAPEVVTQIADLADFDRLDASAAAAWDALGGLQVALLAHGSLPDQERAETDPTIAREAFALNFASPAILCLHLATRFERQRSGTLAVITSVAGDRGRKSNYVYGSAKGGLQRFLEGLRHRLFAAGVRVLDIRPGFTSTRMTAHMPQGGPLWAQPDRVAADIVRAIEQGRAVLYTPWFWAGIMTIVRNLPRPVLHRSSL
jgi:decaprenylphospho-beta-D-erythro-pentofuranosid-2-ulose 2-reductase